MTGLQTLFVSVVGLCLLGGPHAASAVSPNGSQFQVNSLTQGFQSRASVASDAVGNFVAVWSNEGRAIRGQRFDAIGAPIGAEFEISTTTNGQTWPRVARDPTGSFLVVWESFGSAGNDTSSLSLQGRAFDSEGSPLAGPFQVNTYAPNVQSNPSVSSGSAGQFVVTWQSDGGDGSDTSGHSIQGQRYDASGSPLGAQFQVNSYTTGNQYNPSVASDSAGDFVVVWDSDGSPGSDNSGFSIQAQRFDASGAKIGAQFQVNSFTFSQQTTPAVARGSAGNFVVVWESTGSAGSDNSGKSLQGQRFHASGSPAGSQFEVNTFTLNEQDTPEIASDATGDFVVVWHGRSAGGDTSSIQARAFTADGSPYGPDFQVNSYATDDQRFPFVASDLAGDFVVTWESMGSVGNDNSDRSIQAQRYLPEPSLVASLVAALAMMSALRHRQRTRSRTNAVPRR